MSKVNYRPHKKNLRLDLTLYNLGFTESRAKAIDLIKQGKVFVNSKIVKKNSYLVNKVYKIYLKKNVKQWVSRGAIKLLYALEKFDLDVTGKIVYDIGASTGGFTEVCIEKGAKLVYSIDVGTNQLHEKLKKEKKIISIENFNAKYLDNSIIHEKINLVVCDVSFISLTKVIEPSLKLLSSKAEIISLIKPQFETNKINLKKGIVKDPLIHEQVCNDISNWFKKTIKAEVVGLVESPITGPKGNKEFLIYSILKKS